LDQSGTGFAERLAELMSDLNRELAAMDAALATLERTIDVAFTNPNDLANAVALLSLSIRTQREVLQGVVEHISVLTEELARLRAG
jgi:hypothetical protein